LGHEVIHDMVKRQEVVGKGTPRWYGDTKWLVSGH